MIPILRMSLVQASDAARLSGLTPHQLREWCGRRAVVTAPVKATEAAAAAPAGTGLPLTEREREVLERIAAGDSNKLIARAFDLSPHTVKRHVANILDKLGANSRGQAAACYRANL